MKCPKCEGQMIQGFVPEYAKECAVVSEWHEGAPRKSFWAGTKIKPGEGVPIGAFRCQRCGFVKCYADPKFAPQ